MTTEEMIIKLNKPNVELNMAGWEKKFMENINGYKNKLKLSGKQIKTIYNLYLKYTG